MAVIKYNGGDLLPERRGVIGAVFNSLNGDHTFSSRVVRRRKLGRFTKPSFLILILLLFALFLISLSVFGLRLQLPGNFESLEKLDNADNFEESNQIRNEVKQEFHGSNYILNPPKSKRKQHLPCEVGFSGSVNYLIEPQDLRNFTRFSLRYVASEEKPLGANSFQSRFGGHQTLEEREKSFYARNQTLHCGFVQGTPGLPSTGFDLDEKHRAYMSTCRVVVSSCIFGSSDFLRRPTSKKISEFSKKNVCFVMFVDESTQSKLSSDGHIPDDSGHIGLWKLVVVRNLPYEDMRRTGKVPKFLSHRLFPSSSYSIWLDSKMRLNTDPMLILEYFLWRTRSEYAISNHYDRHCVWEEVLQNKRLNKYNHTAIDEQFNFYQSDGLTKFDSSDPNTPLPSYVPEGSFIVRAHTPMSNLFSCLWFNEVDRFTSRDQLSFAYTYLKLRRLNPDHLFYLNMFKDCERRALAKLFRHRALPSTPPGP
ncbi:probable hexosyltransferase MUCI70 isoform X1 [Ricinus communis]|uniref:probable hexosyltransferase MUCI70 isoform X1 n=1 Tax=Ricinus communis TaxID=3988 RepID=UPI00201B1F16|nr:probable hexosyltransferase MUCI70 isoform X1 [Ricinus communis]